MTDLSSVRRELRREQRQLNLRRFLRNRQAVFGSLVLLTMLFVAVFAPLLAPADPDDLPARLDRLQSVLEEAVNLRVRERLRRDPPQAPSVPPRSDEALRRLRADMQLKN